MEKDFVYRSTPHNPSLLQKAPLLSDSTAAELNQTFPFPGLGSSSSVTGFPTPCDFQKHPDVQEFGKPWCQAPPRRPPPFPTLHRFQWRLDPWESGNPFFDLNLCHFSLGLKSPAQAAFFHPLRGALVLPTNLTLEGGIG